MQKKKRNDLLLTIFMTLILLSTFFVFATFPVGKVIPLPTIKAERLEETPIGGYYDDEMLGRLVTGETNYLTSAIPLEEGEYNSGQYIVVKAVDLEPLKAYKLKDANDVRPFRTGRRTRAGRPSFTTNPIFNIDYYNQFFVAALEDGTHLIILADPEYVKVPQNGETVIIPVGRAVKYQSSISALELAKEKYGIKTDLIVSTSNAALRNEMKFKLFMLRLGAAAVYFIIMIVIFTIVSTKLDNSKKKKA